MFYKIITIIGFFFIIGILSSLSSSLYKSYKLDQYQDSLQENISQLKESNQKLIGYIEYLKTDSYKEKKAKELLNLKKIDEIVITLPLKNKSSLLIDDQRRINQLTPQQVWWHYFFGDKEILYDLN